MTRPATIPTRSRLSIWVQAVRPFAFTASLVPGLVAASLAMSFDGPVRWALLPLVLGGCVLLHGGTNMVSEYFDFRNRVDRADTVHSNVLVDGLLPPRHVLWGGVAVFALAALLGAALILARGPWVLWLGLIGLAGGFFYTGKPIGYKYVALGDPLVFTLMGPLMVLGSHFVLTGGFHLAALLVSVPVGCLVAGILVANNLRDIEDDRAAGTRTLAILLGFPAGKVEYYLLLAGAYAGVVAMVLAGVIAPWALLVLGSLPVAARNVLLLARADQSPGRESPIAALDVQTAQLHLLFGLLYCAGLVLSVVI